MALWFPTIIGPLLPTKSGCELPTPTYFLNIVSNLTESASFLKYLTPYGYCDGAEIISKLALDGPKLAIGAAIFVLGVLAAWLYYPKKDLA